MNHPEVRQKYSAAHRIFNFLLGVSSGDETLRLMLGIGGFHAISRDTNNNGEMNKCWWTNKTS